MAGIGQIIGGAARGIGSAARGLGGAINRGVGAWNDNVDPTMSFIMGLNMLANSKASGVGASPLQNALPGMTDALLMNRQIMDQRRAQEEDDQGWKRFLDAAPKERREDYERLGSMRGGRQAALQSEAARVNTPEFEYDAPIVTSHGGSLLEGRFDRRTGDTDWSVVNEDPMHAYLGGGGSVGSDAFVKDFVGLNTDALSEARSVADTARANLQNMQRARSAIEGGAPTGSMAGVRETFGRFTPDGWGFGALGAMTDEQRVQMDEVRRAQTESTLENLSRLSGAISEKELDYVNRAIISADAQPESNLRAIAVMEAVNQRQIRYAQEYERAMIETQGQLSKSAFDAWFEENIAPQIEIPGFGSVAPNKAANDPIELR